MVVVDGEKSLINKAMKIKLLLSDCDGVLTDGGVYYSERGEELKRFSLRDGMGAERLRELAGVDIGIISGENSMSLIKRAEKLKVVELHLASKDKASTLKDILLNRNLEADEVAYIGDDTNDLGIIRMVGLSAAPSDAFPVVLDSVDYRCIETGGNGAFREFAEFILSCQIALIKCYKEENKYE